MHIFISYAKKDTRELALNLADSLNTLDDVTAWVDRSLRAGRSWEVQIETEIDRCDVMIVLYSPDVNRHKSGESESYVLTEIAYAKYTLKKRIIPIMVQPTTPPISLTREHYIDFTIPGLTLDDLIAALIDELDISEATAIEEDSFVRSSLTTLDDSAQVISQVIGDPFKWCGVPAGEFRYQTKQQITLPSFAIAKYLITYRQFQTFIDAEDGFHDKHWWEGLAFDWSKQPGDQYWKISDHPRENVSWYGAVAFCRWLSFKLGGEYAIDRIENWLVRLPTEFEWEKAARGIEGRAYPWGKRYQVGYANIDESNLADGQYLQQTTPVAGYPQGASPYGVLDMSGNVWEWCLTCCWRTYETS